MNDKITIIIPYYQKKKFFKQTINSINSQTYSNFEVIIIFDDDNKDDLHFIKDLIKNDKKIKLIINSKNLGAGKSRNIGIKFSTGSYISFLDSDDYWHKNKLKYQYKFMKKN